MNASNIFLFLIGLFSMTQVRIIGAIGLSEIPIFLCAPFLFLADFNILRRQGFMPLLSLILLTCLGCIVSSLHNHTYYVNAIKGFATPYSMFAVTVVLNHLLKDNLDGMKWLLVGSAFTLILNVFILPMDAEVQAFAEGATGFAAGKIIAESSTIFWISRIRPLITLPIAAQPYRSQRPNPTGPRHPGTLPRLVPWSPTEADSVRLAPQWNVTLRQGAHQTNRREQKFAFCSGLVFTSADTGSILLAKADTDQGFPAQAAVGHMSAPSGHDSPI